MTRSSTALRGTGSAFEDPDYAAVSETPGDDVLPVALDMARTRYGFADRQIAGQTVLEVACGTAHGLGLLAAGGRFVVGIDISQQLLTQARQHYGDRVSLVRCNAMSLPLADAVVDTVVIFEAIYYLRDIAVFLLECRRVLRLQGRLVVCWANPEHFEFSPGAYTFTYPTASDMQSLLSDAGFTSCVYAGFPSQSEAAGQRVRALLKRTAGRLGLIPAGMRGKSFLKRAFYGSLVRFPAELINDEAAYVAPTLLDPLLSTSNYRVLYAAATKVA